VIRCDVVDPDLFLHGAVCGPFPIGAYMSRFADFMVGSWLTRRPRNVSFSRQRPSENPQDDVADDANCEQEKAKGKILAPR